jgi:hypothetical protein
MADTHVHRDVHLSHSQVSEFSQCPRRYHLHRRLGLKPAFMPSGLLFGIAVHEALSLYHQMRLQGEQATPDQLYQVFGKHWGATQLPIHYGSRETEAGLRATARNMLEHYVAEAEHTGEILAVEEAFVLRLSPEIPPIHGRIDLVEQDPERRLVLTDFKTAKSRSEPDPEQLVLYREAIRDFDVTDKGSVTARYVCLLKTKTPAIAIYEPDIPETALPSLVSRYTEIWKAIESGCSFPIIGWWCRGCQWSKYCDQA